MLQAKFNVGRSSAYEDLKIAQAELDASDDGPAQIASPRFAQQYAPGSACALLTSDKAFATDSYKEIPKLIKALDEVKRWNGYALQAEGMSNHVGC